jgi:hypothetical protein
MPSGTRLSCFLDGTQFSRSLNPRSGHETTEPRQRVSNDMLGFAVQYRPAVDKIAIPLLSSTYLVPPRNSINLMLLPLRDVFCHHPTPAFRRSSESKAYFRRHEH